MQFDPIGLMREMMSAQGVNAFLLRSPYSVITNFDKRLREQLFSEYDFGEIIRRLEEICTESGIYMVEDQFSVHYIIIKLPSSLYEEKTFLFIGPYLRKQSNELLQAYMGEDKTTLDKIGALKEYYSGIPHIGSVDALEAQVTILAKHLLGGSGFIIDEVNLRFNDIGSIPEINEKNDMTIRMKVIEERYRKEDDLLKAIELGDHQQAMHHMSGFGHFEIEARFPDLLRDRKNYFITMNSLMRKAVQRADVHPAHIDSTSSFFARKIEASRSIDDLSRLIQDMMRKYCLLVKNHSLRKFSRPIQNVLNYIDFNYVETLSLDMLSTIAGINPSYLSTQFKKEVGTTVTDYVNQSRVQHAQKLLATTSLPINKISEMVGFLDENYFARTFKQHTGKSPTAYRKLFKSAT